MTVAKRVARPLTVVQLSLNDFAGSGYKIARAIERVNPLIKVHCFVLSISQTRKIFNNTTGTQITSDNLSDIQKVVDSADVIHFKGDNIPQSVFCKVKIPKNTPQFITVSGSGFRRGNSNVALALHPIEDYVKRFEYRTVLTPDINYPEYKGVYIPQPIDSTFVKRAYFPDTCKLCSQKKPITIAHSPSIRAKKGTDTDIIPAINMLTKAGYKYHFDLIQNVPNNICVERKSNASVFIDQINEIGAYGNNALEAMQFGIPTISYISETARKQSGGLWDNNPVMSASNKMELYYVLRDLIENPETLEDISKRTKQYTDKHHSYEAVGRLYESFIYEMLYE